jgi:peptide/nickel transport system substrate-binding protein
LEPGLATSWKWVKPTVIEFKLRAGVKFHDGSTMSAEDVAFSLNRVFQKKHPDFSTVRGRYLDYFERVEVVDPLTVHIHLTKQDPVAEIRLSEPQASIVPKAHVEKVGHDGSKIKVIGAGPYKVVSFTPEQELVVERFNDYWGKKAPLKRIQFIAIPEISSRITALVNKEVDIILMITPDQEGALQGRPGIKTISRVISSYHLYVINMYRPPTDNQKVRLAMKLAVDRKKLVQGLWAGKGEVPKTHQFPEYAGMYMPELELVKYDPERARQLVKESGYDGTPIVLAFQPHYYTYGNLAAQAIAEMWEKVGLRVKLQAVDTFSKDATGINIRPWSNSPDTVGVPARFMGDWGKEGWPYRNKMWKGPDHPKWNALSEKVRFSMDVNERREAYRELLTLVENELAGWILLYKPVEVRAMRSDIEWPHPDMFRHPLLTFRAGQIGFKKK